MLGVALLSAFLSFQVYAQPGGFAHPDEKKKTSPQPSADAAKKPSESAPLKPPSEQPSSATGTNQSEWLVPITAGIISVALLAFAGFFLWRLAVLRTAERLGEQAFVKLAGLTIVISSGILLIVSGYSQNQIAGMIGLLGTVAGYLLGRDRESKPPRANERSSSGSESG